MSSLPPNPETQLIPPICIAGPTAVGKSATAIQLAQELDGEIVSFDSMQVYEEIHIGTAKPTPEELDLVPHHLISVIPLTQPFSVSDFVQLARETILDIQKRGKAPILCGGTGLYFRAYFEGLGEAPPSDPQLRAKLEQTPLEQLLEELEQVDPATYHRIDRQNPRRVIRAVEVFRLTGKPYSRQRAKWKSDTQEKLDIQKSSKIPDTQISANAPNFDTQESNPAYSDTDKVSDTQDLSVGRILDTQDWKSTILQILDTRKTTAEQETKSPLIFGLIRPREGLRERIETRVDQMIEAGLVEETQRLLKKYPTWSLTALQAIGYRQIVEHLNGQYDLPTAIQTIKTRTWQFAKRQKTWLRNQMDVIWLNQN